MVFVSFIFLFWFLPLFLAVYYLLPLRGKNLWLLTASYVFYGWFRPEYLILMTGITLIDWWCADRMGEKGTRPHRGWWIFASVASNLLLLGYFKYANLLVESFNAIRAWREMHPVPWESVVLPIGISFHTFQSMSYTIDVYRGDVKPTRSLLDFACFVSMFPQLVAGPIVRYRTVEHELVHRRHSYELFSAGVFLICIGFAKKVLIADNCALLCDPVFDGIAKGHYPGLAAAWTGVTAYAAQIYFDFSGYSDIAIGLASMLGFTLPPNFDSPYQSESITEFWRRWHISLSTWLRDYLYIPLGGNRHGELRTHANLMATMLLGGLWHGASWTFVIWGGYQGAFLVLERLTGRRALYAGWTRTARVAITFVIVLGGWAIFRANDLTTLTGIWGGMLGAQGLGSWPVPELHASFAYVALAVGLVIAFTLPSSRRMIEVFHPLAMLLVLACFVVALGLFFTREYSPFIYWQF